MRWCRGLEDRSRGAGGSIPPAAWPQPGSSARRLALSHPTLLAAAQVAAAAAPAPAPRSAPPAESPRPAPPPPRAARRAGPGRVGPGPGRGGTMRPRLCAARRPQLGSRPACTRSRFPHALAAGFGWDSGPEPQFALAEKKTVTASVSQVAPGWITQRVPAPRLRRRRENREAEGGCAPGRETLLPRLPIGGAAAQPSPLPALCTLNMEDGTFASFVITTPRHLSWKEFFVSCSDAFGGRGAVLARYQAHSRCCIY